MSPALLLKHFDEISDAPDAVPRLRRFILDLAVRGKLVEQDPNDEPADALLERIAGERSRLIKAGEIKKDEPAPIAQVDELPFEVPASWRWVRLAQFAILETGKRMQGGALDNGVISLGGEHVKPDGSIDYSVPRYISRVFFNQMRTGRLALADTVMVKDGATTGKTSFVEFLPEDGKAAINEHVFLIRPFGETNKKLVYLFVRTRAEQHVKPQSQGVIGGIRRDAVLQMLVPFPPLVEQHRIVAKVTELMALCDELEIARTQSETRRDCLVASSLHALTRDGADSATAVHHSFKESARFYFNHLPALTTRPEHIKQLRQTILNLAVRGKLVAQDPGDEPASELLARIDEWKAEAIRRKEIRPPRKPLSEITRSEFTYTLPRGWAWTRLGEIIYIQSGDGLTAENMKGGDFPVYGGNGITGSHDTFNIKQPTIVIGRVGYYCGSVHVTPEKAWVTDNAFITKFCSREIFLKFLVLLLNGTNLKENENATAQPVISGSKIYPIIVAIPPLAEQHRIVAKVGELMALCDELEAGIATNMAVNRQLLKAALHEALDIKEAAQHQPTNASRLPAAAVPGAEQCR